MNSSYLDLLVVSLGTAFGEEKSLAELRQLAKNFLQYQESFYKVHAALEKRWPTYRVKNEAVVRDLHDRGEGMVLCTITMGPHWYSLLHMAPMGIDATAIAGSDFWNSFGPILHRWSHHHGIDLQLLSSSEPRALLQGLRSLAAGRAFLAVLDTNTGVGGVTGGERNNAQFEFLGMPVRMRTGVAWLAQRTQLPIVPAVTYVSDSGETVVEYEEAIPAPPRSDHEGRSALIRDVYARFEPWILRYPAQWAGWQLPLSYWPPAAQPTASREVFETTKKKIRELVEVPGTKQLYADPVRAAAMDYDGLWVILDGRKHRLLEVDRHTASILDLARKQVRIKDLRRQYKNTERLTEDLARMLLSDLVQIR